MSDVFPCKIMSDLKMHGINKTKQPQKNPRGIHFEFFQGLSKTSVTLVWRNPIDIDFTAVRIIAKKDSAPTNANDGLIVLGDSLGKTLGVSDVIIEGYENVLRKIDVVDLESDSNYYFGFYPCDSVGVIKNSPNAFVLNIKTWKDAIVYGFKIDETEASPEDAVTYIDDNKAFVGAYIRTSDDVFVDTSGWTNCFPFNQVRVVTLDNNGNVTGEVNKNDFNVYTDGTSVSGDIMLEIPTVWWFSEKRGTEIYVHISNEKASDDFKAYAHLDKYGVVKEKLYVSVYETVLDETDNKLYSIQGVTPTGGKTTTNFRTYAQNKGDRWSLLHYHSYTLLQILVILMGKTLDSQESFGRGQTSASNLPTNGYHATSGMYAGQVGGSVPIKFMGIENLWGFYGYPLEGVIIDPTYNLSLTLRDNVTTFNCAVNMIDDAYITEVKGDTEFAFCPLVGDDGKASSSTFYCDEGRIKFSSINDSSRIFIQSSYISVGTYVIGIFNLKTFTVNSATTRIGARTEYL